MNFPLVIPVRSTFFDRHYKSIGRENPLLLPCCDNRTSYATSKMLISICEDDIGKFFFSCPVDNIGCGLTTLTVGHKQRFVPLKRESAWCGNLISAPPEVIEHLVDLTDTEPLENTREITEIIIHQMRYRTLRTSVECIRLVSALYRRRIGINADKHAALSEGGEYFCKMSRAAQGRIHDRIARLHIECLEHFLHEHAVVTSFHVSFYYQHCQPSRQRHSRRVRYRLYISSRHSLPIFRPDQQHRL